MDGLSFPNSTHFPGSPILNCLAPMPPVASSFSGWMVPLATCPSGTMLLDSVGTGIPLEVSWEEGNILSLSLGRLQLAALVSSALCPYLNGHRAEETYIGLPSSKGGPGFGSRNCCHFLLFPIQFCPFPSPPVLPSTARAPASLLLGAEAQHWLVQAQCWCSLLLLCSEQAYSMFMTLWASSTCVLPGIKASGLGTIWASLVAAAGSHTLVG